jgi:TRAP-type C4-dicarboxylate transport system substrate-binding protein
MGQTAAEFKKNVEELSGGSITINIQAGGVLGAEGDVLDSMLGGVGMIDLARISAFSLTPYGASRSSLLSIPFTFEGREHFWRYADSPLANELLMEPHNIGLGIRGLLYAEEGFRHFFVRTPITGTADLAGKQLRVSTDPIMVGMVNSLGATATVVPFGELYSALQTGVVDGAEQPIVNYLANSFHEVAPYMVLNAHTLGAAQVIMSDDAWNRLTERQQAVIVEASKIASRFNRGLSEQVENEAIARGEAEGVTFIPVTNVQELRDALAAVPEVVAAVQANQADYDAILALS